MWTDNETDKNFLNLACTTDTVAELIILAHNHPVTIGVSGQWGVGKSSMIKLIKKSLDSKDGDSFAVVEFNAWLYQGYDDARAAFMEVIANTLTRKRIQGKKVSTKPNRRFLFSSIAVR